MIGVKPRTDGLGTEQAWENDLNTVPATDRPFAIPNSAGQTLQQTARKGWQRVRAFAQRAQGAVDAFAIRCTPQLLAQRDASGCKWSRCRHAP